MNFLENCVYFNAWELLLYSIVHIVSYADVDITSAVCVIVVEKCVIQEWKAIAWGWVFFYFQVYIQIFFAKIIYERWNI